MALPRNRHVKKSVGWSSHPFITAYEDTIITKINKVEAEELLTMVLDIQVKLAEYEKKNGSYIGTRSAGSPAEKEAAHDAVIVAGKEWSRVATEFFRISGPIFRHPKKAEVTIMSDVTSPDESCRNPAKLSDREEEVSVCPEEELKMMSNEFTIPNESQSRPLTHTDEAEDVSDQVNKYLRRQELGALKAYLKVACRVSLGSGFGALLRSLTRSCKGFHPLEKRYREQERFAQRMRDEGGWGDAGVQSSTSQETQEAESDMDSVGSLPSSSRTDEPTLQRSPRKRGHGEMR